MESIPRPSSMTHAKEDMDFNVPQWIGRAVRVLGFYLGYRTPVTHQGIGPRDFGLQTRISPPIPPVSMTSTITDTILHGAKNTYALLPRCIVINEQCIRLLDSHRYMCFD